MTQSFNSKVVTLGDVTFDIRKLLSMPAFALYDRHIQPALRDALGDGKAVRRLSFWGLVFAFPADVVERVRLECFREVLYKTADMPTAQVLAGNEEEAFEGLEGAHGYEVMARSFCRNYLRVLLFKQTPLSSSSRATFSPVKTRSIPDFFANPISANKCTMAELKRRGPDGDPELDLWDICVLNEVLRRDHINEQRALKAAENKGKNRRR